MLKRPKIKITSARVIRDELPDFDHDAILYVYTVDGVEVRAIHWSGRFDGDVEDLVFWLLVLRKKFNPDYITTTESQQKGALVQVREAFGPGWRAVKTGEYILLWDHSVFGAIPRLKPHVVVSTRIKNWALWRQMHVGYFNIRHRKLKMRWRIIVVHGPSGIQNGGKPKLGKQWSIAKAGWPKLGKSMQRFARLHPRTVQVLPADTNANQRESYWAKRFASWLNATSIWKGRVPNQGSHKNSGRLIDGVWIKNAE